MNADQKKRAQKFIANWNSEDGWDWPADQMAALLQELIDEQPASVPDGLETTRFLTDVTTAAGLLAHGRRDKGLAQRIGDFANKYRMIAAANPSTVLALLDEMDALNETIRHMRAELEKLRTIEAAALNLAKVKGRHNSEIAMNKLLEALK